MRDWRKHWRSIDTEAPSTLDQALRQVGKTVMGVAVDPTCLDIIVDAIASGLEVTYDDVVVDLGCGNGLVTARVATRVKRVAGVDISEPLIEAARTSHSVANVSYHPGDIAALDALPIEGVTKGYMYEVLQHLSTEDTRTMLSTLRDLIGERLVIFAGSIPERARLTAFYDTPERWAHYQRRTAEDAEQIGHWWEREELVELCRQVELACTPRDQAPELYTSHYRFDARIVVR